jgi:endonuclease YncB( thermonuclease family)
MIVVGGLRRCRNRRWRSGILLAGAIILFLLFEAGVAAAEEIRGDAQVISGNEMVVGDKSVRLFGIAAPGLDDTCKVNDANIKCGIVAWGELIKLADGQYVSCDVETVSDTKQPYATCYISETDLNEALVRAGWAKAVLQQTDRYAVDQADAKESRRGLWASFKPARGKRGKKGRR